MLDDRFRTVLGMPPIRYLAGWRMHLARDLLESSELGVAAIAHRVGYESEEAFSRAFKRAHGVPPRQWRQTSGRLPKAPRSRSGADRAPSRCAGLPQAANLVITTEELRSPTCTTTPSTATT
jgi:hypothetical protein